MAEKKKEEIQEPLNVAEIVEKTTIANLFRAAF